MKEFIGRAVEALKEVDLLWGLLQDHIGNKFTLSATTVINHQFMSNKDTRDKKVIHLITVMSKDTNAHKVTMNLIIDQEKNTKELFLLKDISQEILLS